MKKLIKDAAEWFLALLLIVIVIGFIGMDAPGGFFNGNWLLFWGTIIVYWGTIGLAVWWNYKHYK